MCHLRSVSSGRVLCLHSVYTCNAECKGGNELISCDELGKCGRKVLRRLCVHGWRLSTSSCICMPDSIRSLRCRSHVIGYKCLMVGWLCLTSTARPLCHVMLPTNSLQEGVTPKQPSVQISRFISFTWWQRQHQFQKMSVYIAKARQWTVSTCPASSEYCDRRCMIYMQNWHDCLLHLPVACSLYLYNCMCVY